jgi:hypothetical protein
MLKLKGNKMFITYLNPHKYITSFDLSVPINLNLVQTFLRRDYPDRCTIEFFYTENNTLEWIFSSNGNYENKINRDHVYGEICKMLNIIEFKER